MNERFSRVQKMVARLVGGYCTLMPQTLPLLTLTLVHMLYEESTPLRECGNKRSKKSTTSRTLMICFLLTSKALTLHEKFVSDLSCRGPMWTF